VHYPRAVWSVGAWGFAACGARCQSSLISCRNIDMRVPSLRAVVVLVCASRLARRAEFDGWTIVTMCEGNRRTGPHGVATPLPSPPLPHSRGPLEQNTICQWPLKEIPKCRLVPLGFEYSGPVCRVQVPPFVGRFNLPT